MNLQIKKVLVSTIIMGTIAGILFSNNNINNESIYLGVANNVEKSLSIDINDFYYQTDVPVAFTSGSTTGISLVANNTSTCEIPVSGRFGHSLGDINGGYRINDNTLFIRINLGSKKITGLGGNIYTVSSRTIRLTQNAVQGSSSYVSNNSTTYINIGNSGSASGTNIITAVNRINITQIITGEIEIRASGSIGFTEMIIYYTE
jgi:hypothetical protein